MSVARQAGRLGISALIVSIILVPARPVLAYLKFGVAVNSRQVTLRWTATPVRYFVTNQGVSGVSATDFQAAVARAFSTWQAVPTASISYVFGGYTANLPGEDDGRSALGFVNEPALDRVLASTSYLIDDLTGELIEADIFFNSAFAWSIAANGEHNRWDVETIALHEVGHLSGLGHSAIGETEMTSGGRHVVSTGAVMFPIAIGPGDISGRRLAADDIAGISDLYPDSRFSDDTGSISGRVTRNGRGVFGAHVVAFDPAHGDLVANFTLDSNGQFSIAGLQPGPHVVRVEPLDDADTASFFDETGAVELTFRARYHDRLVVVPRGGDSGAVQIAVGP